MIEKISISNIIKFRSKSDKSQITFINNLKKSKKEIPEGGGDYWITASSTISNFFRNNNKKVLFEKIEELIERSENAKAKISKNMYQRNISILNSFDDFSFSNFKPPSEITYLSKPKRSSILKLKGVPIQIKPNFVFSFKEKGIDKVGAIWFIIKLNGFDTPEITLFTDSLYRYLKFNFQKDFSVDPRYCVALDLVSQKHIRYTQIESGKINSELISTLEKIRKLL